VFENRVLRRKFGPKWEVVAGGWKRLHNEKLSNLHASPIIFRVIKWRMMRWASYMAHMGDMRNSYNIFILKPKGREYLGDLDVD
jgi:hypothetical protein